MRTAEKTKPVLKKPFKSCKKNKSLLKVVNSIDLINVIFKPILQKKLLDGTHSYSSGFCTGQWKALQNKETILATAFYLIDWW